MCLFAILAGVAPRLAFAVYWIARPGVVEAVFGTFLWPLLGLIFLPFTTLMYTILWTPGIGVTGWDWLWIILGLFLDLTHWAQVYQNKNNVPGTPMYTGSPTP